ncbi:MAG: ATP-binding protein [Proteobacteria bacterium]|nr:ATP-binding protein [Pseudomonadota bacterium]
MLETLGPNQLIALGAAAAALVLLPLAILFNRHAERLGAEKLKIEQLAHRAHNILAASPDGIFLWDHGSGGISCSRRLAEMLKIEAGVQARYDDIRACFSGDELGRLERGVSLLRAKGAPFEVLLRRGEQLFHTLGTRAFRDGEHPIADVVWMRDISAAATALPTVLKPRNGSTLEDRHLTALLDILPVPLWLRDPALAVVFANRAADGVSGLDDSVAKEAMAAQRSVSRATPAIKDGEALQFRVTETPLGQLGGGGTVGFAVPETGSSPGEAATAALPFPVELIEPLEAGIAVFDADGTLAAANSAFAELWHLDPEWLATRPSLNDLLLRLRDLRRLPEVTDFAQFRRQETARLSGIDGIFEELMHLPDGRDIRRRIASLPGGGMVMAADDLSGRHEMQRTLTSQDRVQRTTLENLREGIAVFGGDGRLRLANKTLLTLFEIPPDDITGDIRIGDVIDLFGWRFAADEQPWPDRRQRITSAILGNRDGRGSVELINGRVFAYSNVALPDGAVLISYADITDSHRVEQALRDRARMLAETDKLKTEFIANVAHEVRTPLATISGFAEILTEQLFGDLNERQIGYARGIFETAAGMRDVVTDIFDLATIEAGRMELDLDTVDPHAAIVWAIGANRERMRRKSIEISLDCPADIGWITADERRLKQIVMNLLGNAVTFTPKLGRITVGGERHGDEISIWVSDTGPGIPKDDRERVFQPFDRGAKPGTRGTGSGAGLGLTIVRRFTELHGGSVEIAQNRERGAKITVRLPVDPESRRELAQTAQDRAIVDDAATE